MTAHDADLKAAIALSRFGFGARPGEIEVVRVDPRAWLLGQIRPEGADPVPGVDPASDRLRAFVLYDRQVKALKREKRKPDPAFVEANLGAVERDALARVRLAATTPAGFRERWTHFWTNHFTISRQTVKLSMMAAPFEQEAIRPHVFGRFRALLGAAVTHPTMLTYLNQVNSTGPNSGSASRSAKRRGLNENLARELLELHTIGVDAGYTQTDVTEVARALTGLTIAGGISKPTYGRTRFNGAMHEPGARTVMGVVYPQKGRDQAEAILDRLAAHPATARRVATKLARHFHSDSPSPALIARLEEAYRRSDGRLDVVASALIDAPQMWDAPAAKFKTPHDFMVSGWRALGVAPEGPKAVVEGLQALGQPTFMAPSPKGWEDTAGTWCSPDGLVRRMAISRELGAAHGDDRDPKAVAEDALGARLTPRVRDAVARAETRAEGVAILLMSPEFQRR